MGKIVKFCSKCEESFDNKFSFCPNCAESLEAFEMKPVTETKTEEVVETPKTAVPEEIEIQKPAFLVPPEESLTETETVTLNKSAIGDDILELDVEGENTGNKIEMPISGDESFQSSSFENDEVETIVAGTPKSEVETVVAKTPKAKIPNGLDDEPAPKYGYRNFTPSSNYAEEAGDNFHITVIQEKNVKERGFLFMGAAALIFTLICAGFVYSLFTKSLDLAAIDSDSLGVLVPDLNEAPMEVEEIEKPKNEDTGGGGGGGGRENPLPTSNGQLAPQTSDPIKAPSVTDSRANTELKLASSTQGDRKIPQTDRAFGDENSVSFTPSDGQGSGGGQGTGLGRGQGSGNGTGIGSGNGSGSGNGNGNGNGDGTGDGDNRPRTAPPAPKPDPPKPAGPSTGLKIISKPKANYTDAARVNNVQGNVTLRVTFLANGQIGSISSVSGLGYGLTEQAIAAARRIQFEPPKRNGDPYTTTKSVVFSFTIY